MILYNQQISGMLYRASLKSQLMSRVAYGFSGKSYDLAVIGGGPGGNRQS